MTRPQPRKNWHYALGEDFWTLCRTYWADAVDCTSSIGKVTCPRCLIKWEEQRANGRSAD